MTTEQVDFDLLIEWHNKEEDDPEKIETLIRWLENLKPKRVQHIQDFLRWRESAFKAEFTVDELADDLKTKGMQRVHEILNDIPENHKLGFLEFLAWLYTGLEQKDVDNVASVVLLFAYSILIMNASVVNMINFENNSRRSWFSRSIAFPITALRKMGLINTFQSISDKYMDKQIKALQNFVPNTKPNDPELLYQFLKDQGAVGRIDALRSLMLYHARRINDWMAMISSGVTMLTEGNLAENFDTLAVPFVFDENDFQINPRIINIFNDEFNDTDQSFRVVFKDHQDEALVVLQALIDIMLANAVLAGNDDYTSYEDTFRRVVSILNGNFPNLSKSRYLYRNMIKNPFVNYGSEHTIEGIKLGKNINDIYNDKTPVDWNVVYRGEYAKLLNSLRSVSTRGQEQTPENDFEREVVRQVESMMDPSQLFYPISSILNTALTYTFQPETLWNMLTNSEFDIEFKKGTILAFDVENLRNLIRRATDFTLKNFKISWKTTPYDGGGSQEDAEFEVMNENGSYDSSDTRINEYGLVILDDIDSNVIVSAKDTNDKNYNVVIKYSNRPSIVSEAREYLQWIIDGENGNPPKSKTSKRLTVVRNFVEREESKKMAARPMLQLIQEIRNAVLEKLIDVQGLSTDVDLEQFATRKVFIEDNIDPKKRDVAIMDANARADALLEGRPYMSTYEEELKGIDEKTKRDDESRFKKSIRKTGEALDKLASKTGTGLKRLIDNDLTNTVVHRSPVCAPDGTEPTELQKLMKQAIDNADRYLNKQYQMFGLWGIFNLMLIAVLFYLLYKIWQVLFQYYQFKHHASKSVGTPNSNNIFDPADDDDNWEPKASDIAKMRVPSGAAIESRLRRYSKESGTDLSETIDSSKDKYPKKETDNEEDDDYI